MKNHSLRDPRDPERNVRRSRARASSLLLMKGIVGLTEEMASAEFVRKGAPGEFPPMATIEVNVVPSPFCSDLERTSRISEPKRNECADFVQLTLSVNV